MAAQFDMIQAGPEPVRIRGQEMAEPRELGMMSGYGWVEDPKRLVFNAARYKFVAKMLEGKASVLEVGCADAFYSRIVRQHVGSLVAVDCNTAYIGSAKKVSSPKWKVYLNSWDILKEGPLTGFDAVYALDLFEHIADEDLLLGNLAQCAPVCIVGAPSLESQAYASAISKAEHVNCKSKEGLRAAMQRHFRQVFMLGMNDETLHTGIMAAYLFAIGVNP